MSMRLFRILAALGGTVGVAALGYYYLVPFPLPALNASTAQVTSFALQYHNIVFFDTGLQIIGALFTIIFFLALVYIADAMILFSGWMTLLASILILTTVLAEGALALSAVQAGISGEPGIALTCFSLIHVFIRVFLLLPVPLLFLALAAVLFNSVVLPRVFGLLAFILGIGFAGVGCVSLFNPAAAIANIFLLAGLELWVIAAAIVLLATTKHV